MEPIVSPCGTAAGAARASGFGSPLVLRDFSSRCPGDGGSDPGRPAPTEAQRGGSRSGSQFTVHCHSFLPSSPHASGSPLGWRTGENFQGCLTAVMGPFSPSDTPAVDIRPQSRGTLGSIHPLQPGWADRQGILLPRPQRPPPHLGPHTGRVGPEALFLSQGPDWNLGER